MMRRGLIKHAVRRAIHHAGGIVPVAAALDYSDSHVGRWNSQAEKALPDLEQALDLDDLALSCGGRAEILEGLARQLGHVVFRLPQGFGDAAALTVQLAKATSEFGDIAQAVVEALGDGAVDNAEAGRIAGQIDEAVNALIVMRALVVEEETASSSAAVGRQGVTRVAVVPMHGGQQ